MFAGENFGSRKRTITANSNKSFNAIFLQVFKGLLSPFFGKKILAARRLKNGATTLNDIPNIITFEQFELVFNHTLITMHNPVNLESVV